jgi:hypothetical protein
MFFFMEESMAPGNYDTMDFGPGNGDSTGDLWNN